MNTKKMFSPLTRAWTVAPHLSASVVGGALGFLRRREPRRGRWGFIGGGALAIIAGVFLLATRRRRQMVASPWANEAAALLGGRAEKPLADQGGAHPVVSGKIVEAARELAFDKGLA
jgi:hypothetical protein